jgi:hypothetical protein
LDEVVFVGEVSVEEPPVGELSVGESPVGEASVGALLVDMLML